MKKTLRKQMNREDTFVLAYNTECMSGNNDKCSFSSGWSPTTEDLIRISGPSNYTMLVMGCT